MALSDNRLFSRFDRTLTCDGQTHGQRVIS